MEKYTFYIFALHFPIIQLLNKIYNFNGLVGYILVFSISISISIITGSLMNKI